MMALLDLGGRDWRLSNGNGSIDIVATVPGNAHSDLMAAGLIGDPNVGYNDVLTQWIASDDWRFSKEFDLPAAAISSHADLVCDGLDTVANLTLNGQALESRPPNQFLRQTWRLPAGLLRASGNELVVWLAGPVPYTAAQAASYPYEVGCASFSNGLPHANFIRKWPSDFGWDWGPAIAPTGIFRNISLRWFAYARLEDLWAEITLAEDAPRPTPSDPDRWPPVRAVGGPFKVHVSASVRCEAAGGAEVRFEVAGVAQSVEVQCERAGAVAVVSDELLVSRTAVQLWWPIGYGSQQLYPLVASLTQTAGRDYGSLSRMIGFRTVHLVRGPLPGGEEGESEYFEVNGVPIFARGASLVPLDTLETRVSDAYLESVLRSAVAANFNMVRVWGGGSYMDERFWSRCDELGLLVWLDFQFASALYPRDEAFVGSVVLEVTQQARRLVGHASLVVFCGSNEAVVGTIRQANKGGHIDLGLLRQFTADLAVLFDQGVRRALWEVAPHVSFYASSPSNDALVDEPGQNLFIHRWLDGGLDSAFDGRYGDVRHYDYYSECTDTSLYPRGRFVSEYGWQSYPSLFTLAEATSPVDWSNDSPMMNHRQRHPDGNAQLASQMSRFFDVANATFERFVFLSQAVQSLCISTQTRFYRALKQTPGAFTYGALYWQLNDVWQGQSWSSLEYGGRWKLLHYSIREAFAPLSVSIFSSAAGSSAAEVNITAVSDDTTRRNCSLQIQSWSWDGALLYHNTTRLTLQPLTAVTIWRTSVGSLTGGRARNDAAARCTLTCDVAGAPVTSTSTMLPRSFVGVPLRPPQISYPPDSFRTCGVCMVCFSLHSEALAAFVFLSTPLTGHFDQNGLLLPPGETRAMIFHSAIEVKPLDLMQSLDVQSAAG